MKKLSQNWRVLPFVDVVKDSTAGNAKIAKNDYLESGVVPIIDQGKELIGGFTNDLSKIVDVELPVIIFGDHTRIFKFIENPFVLGADGAKILEPKIEHIDKKYLFHYLNQLKIESAGYSRHYKFLKEFNIIVPPLEEQKRIAAILDKADAIRQKRQKAIELADEFLRSVFLDMFGDPVTNPKGWDTFPIDKISQVVTGNTPPRSEKDNYGSHIEWIKSDNINTPNHYLTKAEEYLSLKGLEKGRIVPEGAILITCIAGSPQCIGNVAITNRTVAFNQQINALIPSDMVTTQYLYSLVLFGKKLIQSISTNSMKGMVSKGNLEKLCIPVPPIELQNKYSSIFKSLEERVNLLCSSNNYANDLFASIQKKAFSGEL